MFSPLGLGEDGWEVEVVSREDGNPSPDQRKPGRPREHQIPACGTHLPGQGQGFQEEEGAHGPRATRGEE